MGEEFYAHYTQVLADEAATEREVGRHDIRWAIVPYAQAPKLTGRLSADPKWRLAWFDAVAAVFVREGPGAEAWVDPSAAAALRPAPRPPAASAANGSAPAFAGGACATPLRPGDPSGGRLSRWFSGFVRAPAYPHEALQRGIFHLYRGELAQAEARFGDAVAEGGSELHDPWQNLGAVLWRQGRRADAAYCYRQVLALDPANGTAWKRLREMGAD
jgi:tetratricopeptide (TPR) repeat protein